jgi:hypothetical protein
MCEWSSHPAPYLPFHDACNMRAWWDLRESLIHRSNGRRPLEGLVEDRVDSWSETLL